MYGVSSLYRNRCRVSICRAERKGERTPGTSITADPALFAALYRKRRGAGAGAGYIEECVVAIREQWAKKTSHGGTGLTENTEGKKGE